MINTYELRDLNMNGGNFTWSNNQENPTLERLDRILISEDWESMFPLTTLRKVAREMSDHNPLLLCTDQERVNKSKHSCFENAWLKHQDFVPKIKEIWERQISCDNVVERWCIKINRVKKFLKGWGKSLRGHNKKYRNILQKELLALEKLEEEDSLPRHLLERKTFIQTEMHRLLEEEEAYWHKRSNMSWLLKGDLSTEFFHRVANGKKGRILFSALIKMMRLLKEMKISLGQLLITTKPYLGPLIAHLINWIHPAGLLRRRSHKKRESYWNVHSQRWR